MIELGPIDPNWAIPRKSSCGPSSCGSSVIGRGRVSWPTISIVPDSRWSWCEPSHGTVRQNPLRGTGESSDRGVHRDRSKKLPSRAMALYLAGMKSRSCTLTARGVPGGLGRL